MDNCNKCLYQPICNAYAALGVTDVPADDVTPCELFKNKEDIAEVVHGEWIVVGRTKHGKSILKCSHCGRVRKNHGRSSFCCDCGAQMDGGSESHAKSEN